MARLLRTLIPKSRLDLVVCLLLCALISCLIHLYNAGSKYNRPVLTLQQSEKIERDRTVALSKDNNFTVEEQLTFTETFGDNDLNDGMSNSAEIICPLKYNTTVCKIEIVAKPSERISREPSGRTIRYIYRFRQVMVKINNEIAQKWRSTADVFLAQVDNGCKIVDTSVWPSPAHRTNQKAPSEQNLLEEYLNKLPNGTVLLGAVYGDTTTFSPKLHHIGLPKSVTHQVVNKRGIIVFLLRKGYHGHNLYELSAKGGNETSLRKEFQFGHRFNFDTTLIPYGTVLQNHPEISDGGHWKPSWCLPRWKIALIIPFRQREQHLWTFLENIFRFLQQQEIEFSVFVIEQAGPVLFNRAALMNVGYLEARKVGHFDCYAFHDVDQIPEDLANLYRCSDNPRHLVVTRSVTEYRSGMTYDYFGGAIMMSSEQIERINGFPNRIFGWGGEDDEMLARITQKGMSVLRYAMEIACYVSLSHGIEESNPHIYRKRLEIHSSIGQYISKDGLNSLKYDVIANEKRSLYFHVTVYIPGPQSEQELKPIVTKPTTKTPPIVPSEQKDQEAQVDYSIDTDGTDVMKNDKTHSSNQLKDVAALATNENAKQPTVNQEQQQNNLDHEHEESPLRQYHADVSAHSDKVRSQAVLSQQKTNTGMNDNRIKEAQQLMQQYQTLMKELQRNNAGLNNIIPNADNPSGLQVGLNNIQQTGNSGNLNILLTQLLQELLKAQLPNGRSENIPQGQTN